MSREIIDLTGKVFGRLLILGKGNPKQSTQRTYVSWRCICLCGKIIETKTSQLLSGKTQSCGCLRKENSIKAVSKDITNKRFGNLLAIKIGSKSRSGKIKWLCRCDCGNEKEILRSDLVTGQQKSCGCLWKERITAKGENHFAYNKSLTYEERLHDRSYLEYYEWRKAVFIRDKFTCQICGEIGKGNLNAHHIENYSAKKEKRTLLSNGITLCLRCHKNFHHNYGYKNNNKLQILELKKEILSLLQNSQS